MNELQNASSSEKTPDERWAEIDFDVLYKSLSEQDRRDLACVGIRYYQNKMEELILRVAGDLSVSSESYLRQDMFDDFSPLDKAKIDFKSISGFLSKYGVYNSLYDVQFERAVRHEKVISDDLPKLFFKNIDKIK